MSDELDRCIDHLNDQLELLGAENARLKAEIDKSNARIKDLEADRDKWLEIAAQKFTGHE